MTPLSILDLAPVSEGSDVRQTMLGVNVVAAQSDAEARRLFTTQ